MIRKFAPLALTILLAVLCIGLSHKRQQDTNTEPEYVHSAAASVAFSNEEEMVRSLRESLQKHDWKICMNFNASGEYMEDLEPIVSDLMTNALLPTGNSTQGDYIRYQFEGYTLSCSHTATEDGYAYHLEIIPEYYTTLSEEQEVDEKVKDIINSMHFTPFTSDAKKVRKICTWICENVQYDVVHKKNPYYHLDSSAYGALIYGNAGCQGYSVALCRLLNEVGINCRVITGIAGEAEFHAWNLVELGGKWYNLDLTWTDQSENDEYYLRCDASFAEHQRDDEFLTEEFQATHPMAEKDFQ